MRAGAAAGRGGMGRGGITLNVGILWRNKMPGHLVPPFITPQYQGQRGRDAPRVKKGGIFAQGTLEQAAEKKRGIPAKKDTSPGEDRKSSSGFGTAAGPAARRGAERLLFQQLEIKRCLSQRLWESKGRARGERESSDPTSISWCRTEVHQPLWLAALLS